MSQQLNGTRVAILATDGFEEAELASPRKALQDAGAQIDIVAPKSGTIRAWAKTEWGGDYPVDRTLDEVKSSDYHALMLPGGVLNPDQLRQNDQALSFTRQFFKDHKPVGAICHGPWILINADVVEGRTMTSYPSIAQDLKNAGANWVDEEVVVDSGFVTSRKPDDLDAFNAKLIEEIDEGKHSKQHA
ncbi:type 1 glutamine amidotransferase domain-containing protein [Phytohalomonas tamaricis]|uniref:type 1 glutamine amidotransferase domain-containing protein n=1 Tax=Phytohalomonas tamaricis TaxID=2081032 RepID=UPI000D0B18B3|nr:type 1 glutamine amidotransferase domain-containing protein [Phytohalomonas tamaricis]